MRIFFMAAVLLLSLNLFCFAQGKALLIDDFEIDVSGPPDGTVDFGSGNGSSVEVVTSSDIWYSGNKSLGIAFDAVQDGYMWIARGFELDAKDAAWLVKPEDIDWAKFNAISFYMYGSDSKAMIAFDIKDNGFEMWRYLIEDNFTGWKQIVCPFSMFMVRDDWQPNSADNNATLDFPIKSFQFEPRPVAKGTLYFDKVRLLEE